LGLLHQLFGQAAFEMEHMNCVREAGGSRALLATMLQRRINSPLTSSAGRLFDAVASLAGLRQRCRFEGQAAMELEFALGSVETDEAYPLPVVKGVADWGPMIEALLVDVRTGEPASTISARFHNALVESIIAVARVTNEQRVLLSGGCFQNKYLTERAVRRLREEGFRPYWHQRVPPNDGGIALGQALAAIHAAVANPQPMKSDDRTPLPCV
jgi:hydrogenase maturation protein HypF